MNLNKSGLVTTAILLASIAAAPVAHADAITGEINFYGFWQALDSGGSVVTDFALASSVDILGDQATVQAGATGDFSGLDGSTATYNDFTFDPVTVPIIPLWSVGAFTFDLTSMNVVTQTSNSLALTGSGVVRNTAGDSGTFDWEFEGEPTNFGFNVFVNNAQPTVVPESSTLSLLSTGLFAVGALGYRRRRS